MVEQISKVTAVGERQNVGRQTDVHEENDFVREVKVSAICHALLESGGKNKEYREFLSALSYPKSISTGDFYWVHKHKRYAVIILGDATGHDAYSAVIHTAVAGFLRNYDLRMGKDPKKAPSPNDIMRYLHTRFGELMRRAQRAIKLQARQPSQNEERLRDIAAGMGEEGLNAVCCVIDRQNIRICSSAIPAFICRLRRTKSILPVGQFDDPISQKGQSKTTGSERLASKSISARALVKKKFAAKWVTGKCSTASVRAILLTTDGLAKQVGTDRSEFGDTRIIAAFQSAWAAYSDGGGKIERRLQQALRAIDTIAKEHRGNEEPGDDLLFLLIDIKALFDQLSP